MSNSSQRVRGKFGSGQRLRAFCKKSRTLWPQLLQWAFAKFKPKGARKILFGPRRTCILQKVTYLLAPTATVDVSQIQAKEYEKNVVRAKGYVHFAKSHIPLTRNILLRLSLLSSFTLSHSLHAARSFKPSQGGNPGCL